MTNLSHLSLWNQEVVCEFAWSFVIAPIHTRETHWLFKDIPASPELGGRRWLIHYCTDWSLRRGLIMGFLLPVQTGWTNTLGHFVIFVFSFFFFSGLGNRTWHVTERSRGGSLRTESEEMIRPVCFIGNILELFFGVSFLFCLFGTLLGEFVLSRGLWNESATRDRLPPSPMQRGVGHKCPGKRWLDLLGRVFNFMAGLQLVWNELKVQWFC